MLCKIFDIFTSSSNWKQLGNRKTEAGLSTSVKISIMCQFCRTASATNYRWVADSRLALTCQLKLIESRSELRGKIIYMQNVWYFYLNQTETDQLGNRGKRPGCLSENMCSAGTATRGDWLWPDETDSQSELRGKIYMQNIWYFYLSQTETN